MKSHYFASFFFLVTLAIAITLACGSPASHIAPSCSSMPTVTNSGMPQSVTLCPAVADAQDYPNGQVQFTAIGAFQTAPSPALVKTQIWGVCQDGSPTTAVTISIGGLAQCAAGSTGTYSIYAVGAPLPCDFVGLCGAGCQVSGYAKLTCP